VSVCIDLFIYYRLESKNKTIAAYDEEEEEDDDDLEQETKIYYASRTHSQLSQFVHEVGKTIYAKDIYEVSLASRKNMCINKQVRELNNVNKINEACLDLQKKGKQ
jgi:chromosome transmission fidelity protein 1